MAGEIVIRVTLDESEIGRSAKTIETRVGNALNAGADVARRKADQFQAQLHSAMEAKERLHAQKLEAIHALSSSRLQQIESRRQAQIDVIRERAFQQEQSQLKRLESQAQQSARSISNAFRAIGGLLPGVGVAAFGSAAISRAFDFDNTRVQLAAFVGGVDNANKKLAEFSRVAQATAGVSREKLVQAFIDLKAQARLADDQATKLAVSIAKLQALFPKAQNTAQNLAQIFNQGFELGDVKQERGQTGDFIDSVIKRLGFEGPKALELIRKAKEAGKLTQRAFFDAVDAEVVSRSANLTESLQLRMTKALEATNEKLAELGDKLLKSVIPALDKLLPSLNAVLDVFNKLPGTAQAAAIGILAVAPAIGSVTQAIIGLRGAFVGLGAFLTSPAGIVALAALGVGTAAVALQDLIQNKIPANVRNQLNLGDRSLLTPEGPVNLGVGNIPGFRVEGNKIVRDKPVASPNLGGTGKAARDRFINDFGLNDAELLRHEAELARIRESNAAVVARRAQAEAVDLLALATSREIDLKSAQSGIDEHMSELARAAREAAEAQEKHNEELKEAIKLAQEMDPAFRFMRGLRGETDATASAFERLGQSIGDAFGDFGNLLSSLGNAVKRFFGDLLSATLRTATASVLGPLFGQIGGGIGGLFRTPSTFPQALAAAAGAGGGITAPASITQTQQIVSQLFNAGSPFAPAQRASGIFANGAFGAALGGGRSGGILGGIFNKVFGGGAVSALPLLLGGQLGAGLGGQSLAGNILGAIGGGAVGLGAAFGASVFSAAGGGLGALGPAALAALGPAALIGAPLLVGAILLGKAAQRRKDEEASGQMLTQALQGIEELAAAVSSGQIDGPQARSLFEGQVLAQFIAGINTLKTESVRKSRLTNQVRDLRNVFEARIPPLVAEQQKRAADQARFAAIDRRLIPQFAIGGISDGGLAVLHPNEMVLTPQHQAMLQFIGGANVFERIGVPGVQQQPVFDRGGIMSTSSLAPVIVINIDAVVDSEGIFIKGGSGRNGERVIAGALESMRTRGKQI
jgi:hypothetical protein